MNKNRQKSVIYIYCTIVLSFVFANSYAAKGFTITETFKNSVASDFVFGGDPIAYLTSGIDDPEGEGWLRLTKDTLYQKGSAILDRVFSSDMGVVIELEYKTWRTRNFPGFGGADGFSVFLYDADVANFHIGAYGGSLGYAQYSNGGNVYPGLSGGYFGLGIDEFGNYSNPTEGRVGGTGMRPNTVGLRGPESRNYAWITGNSNLAFHLQYPNLISTRPTDDLYYRHFLIELSPDTVDSSTSSYSITLKVKSVIDGTFETVFGPYRMPEPPPPNLRFGFAASTGAGVNFHEVRNLHITTAGGIRLTKEVNKGSAQVGENLTYTIHLFNQHNELVTDLLFNDPLTQFPPEFQVESVSFNNNGNLLNTAQGFSNSNLSDVKISLGPSSNATFTVTGRINAYPNGGEITNTAVFSVGSSGFTDEDTTNNTATVTTTVLREADFHIPNVFTPNGDGINDEFRIIGLENYDNAQLRVFNRLGNQVYVNSHYINNWDGDGLNGGTYYYFIILERNNISSSYKGWVLIKK
ncbi:MAG: gliding motility-associated C-terminal domain-containing protein [Bacteroidales bacterium]|nr:gliding motility-associated C-terminal domain-containing protein [Bacteroidales bacterium]